MSISALPEMPLSRLLCVKSMYGVDWS